jgi:CRISPR-associated protein Csm1
MLQYSSRGIQRLGVLRADLDGAGALFSRGLGKAMRLARLMALSSALSRFFEGYVETLCETVEQETGRPDTLYAVYAGGTICSSWGPGMWWPIWPRACAGSWRNTPAITPA